MEKIKKILLLGSGALKVGQAGEFDYSGSQALKALREEGVKTVLINPNIATIQTSEGMADSLYFLPITAFFVERVIEKEKPDGLLLSFGGQTALNCGIELHKNGILEKHGVRVLGTPIQAIIDTEDREKFNQRLKEINVAFPKSIPCKSKEEAFAAVEKIAFPVIVRGAFSLGGEGSGVAFNQKKFGEIIEKVFSYTEQILVEECLRDWKEIEYEVVRDAFDNCVTICNMENFDPMGIHTGESIVVAPSQTLSNQEYHLLRETSIRVVKHLGIVGECNIQFALDPCSSNFKVIEVNARLSRSSALASKATGYPLAFVAAKLALGKGLTELENGITLSTKAFFEPALDYIVVKVPRWDFEKFRNVSKTIGSEMKSVGEVMAIGRTFEEAIQKALRMIDIGVPGLTWHRIKPISDLEEELSTPTDKRVFAIEKALRKGMSVERISELSGIDKWFLFKIKNIVDFEKKFSGKNIEEIDRQILFEAKKLGFSDEQVALNLECSEEEVREKRRQLNIFPAVKQIDTLAAEYPAKTNYLYLTYSEERDDVEFNAENSILVLGSGPYRIGSSVEFDWCAVNAVKALQKLGYSVSMINFNPETVSTDYDECNRLYFDELSFERVQDIFDKEKPKGIVLSTGGQIPNNLAMKCFKAGMNVLGTSPKSIDSAENRYKFSQLCDSLNIDQPEWKELSSTEQALKSASDIGYPVLVRPSYVLSGQAMGVAFNAQELEEFLGKDSAVSKEYPVVISRFILGAKEIEIDAVARNGELLVWAISEHIENAGVHSGDSTMVFPTQKTYTETSKRIMHVAEKLAIALKITGPFNIQFLAVQNNVKVIECNLRASRSFPFVSKVSGKNFIDIAVNAMMGNRESKIESNSELNYVGVKAPQFSFSRLRGADPILSVEMASTGEVACLGKDFEDAFLKSLLSVGFRIPEKNILLSVSGDKARFELLEETRMLKNNGFALFATDSTHRFLLENGVENKLLYKVSEEKQPNISDFLGEKRLDLAIIVSEHFSSAELEDEYFIRRKSIDFGIPLITNLQLAKAFINAISKRSLGELEIQSWQHYLNGQQ